ncbi:hypothetical protein CHS0354_039947 [Potamilus streckersoni]|uniref:DEUBAD domain-containing protein n=1 Tax=Potamilus streckersoni TaxID=2493646 RepID=A0AAE0TIC1_9BIVA|nr:hypothetical protein CHS0354_039947 [Potamilus streckersoni]
MMSLSEGNWKPALLERGGKQERCLFGRQEIQLPEQMIEQSYIFKDILSLETWNIVLTESQRQHLQKFLPTFPENDDAQKRETLRRLFTDENFKFGNPVKQFHSKLRDGYFTPDIAKYAGMCRKIKYREYKYRQQAYYGNLLKDVLQSRQKVFEQLKKLPPDEPIKFEYEPHKPKRRCIEHRVKKRYISILKEVREECEVEDTSSEEEEASPVQRSKKQLFKSLCPIPSPEPTTPSVLATFAAKPSSVDGEDCGDASHKLKRPRPFSPVEVTEEDYHQMLVRHARLLEEGDEERHPELNTQNITLQDIMNRCEAGKKGISASNEKTNGTPPGHSMKKKLKNKERLEKKFKKSKALHKFSPTPHTLNIKSEEHEEIDVEHEEDLSFKDVDSYKDFSFQEPYAAVKSEFGRYASFFSLLRDFITEFPEARVTSAKLEEKVREWQESASSTLNLWVSDQPNWMDAVVSALKFLGGDTIGMSIENFIPYLDYKERAQQWRWIGVGRDSDEQLSQLYKHWLQFRTEVSDYSLDGREGSPPPARSKTAYIVRPSTEEEKRVFQDQELRRFQNPHKAFTYILHGYESVVGPVKGVYSKENAMTKAREHALLVSNRPAFVTILTLVRDAAARLPNGEGTRGDICELLKDSQFLAPGVTDAQINVVVSGALDRLHSEKDPCVKYDVNRKLWIYLHRNRTEEEFERIHQAQGAAVKAKKSLQKPKAPKTTKVRDPSQQSAASTNLKLSTSLGDSNENINVEDLSPSSSSGTASQAHILSSPSPVQQSQSPRAGGQVTPHGQSSPRTGVSVSPKNIGPTISAANLRQVISNIVSAQAGVHATSASPGAVGATQIFSAAQLELIQQAAAEVQAQAQAQAQSVVKQGLPAKTAADTKSQVHVKSDTPTGKPRSVSLELLQNQARVKTLSPVGSPQTATQGIKPELLLQRQTSLLAGQGQGSPQTPQSPQATVTIAMVTKVVTSTTTTNAVPGLAGVNPLVARLVTPAPGSQMMSVSNLLAAQRLQQQGQIPRAAATAFKIQGGNVLQPVTGGKPIHLTGKPMTQAKGQLIQLAGKGQSHLGLIQTPQGTISIIPQSGTAGLVTITQPKVQGTGTPPANSPDPSSKEATSTPTSQPTTQSAVNSPKTTQGNQGIVLSQLAPGSLTLRPGGSLVTSQGKIVATGQSGLFPAQLLVQQAAAGGLKTLTPEALQSLTSLTVTSATSQNHSSSSPIIVSSTGGKPSHNVQVVRTVLSHQTGIRPGQPATILISQPALQQSGATVLSSAQMLQNAGAKVQGKVTPRGKPQPVYARIITPPPGINVKLTNVASTVPQTLPSQSVALLQTVNKILMAEAAGSTPSLVMSSSAQPQVTIPAEVQQIKKEQGEQKQ